MIMAMSAPSSDAPLVSIITATYNRSNVLGYTLRSVQRSTVADWEHLVIGDACTDDTARVVAGLGDPRVRFLLWLQPKQDAQTIDGEWRAIGRPLIAGVQVKEMRHVPTGYGYLTEIWRRDWGLDDVAVDQVFQSTLAPGGVSAWHAHAETTDRLSVNQGLIRVVLYDARRSSPTFGLVNELQLGTIRPGLIVIPPRVWHGVQNADAAPSSLLNLVDRAYRYEGPDHWRLPPDTSEIPYRFTTSRATSSLW